MVQIVYCFYRWLFLIVLSVAFSTSFVLATTRSSCAYPSQSSSVSTFEQRKTQWEAKLRQQPENADLHLQFGRFLLSAGLVDAAIERLKAAAQLNPHDARPIIALAEINLQNLDFPKAQLLAERAIAVQPSSKDARVVLLSTLIQREQLKAAKLQLDYLLESDADDPQVLYLAYKVKAKVGAFPAAQKYLERAVALRPNQTNWLLELSKLYEDTGDAQKAHDLLKRVVSKWPRSVEARMRLARNNEVYCHDFDAAIDEYRRVLGLDGDAPGATAGIERCQAKKNNLALRLKQLLKQSWRF